MTVNAAPRTPGAAQRQRVVVVGAGYASLLAALRLAPHAHVTLVDPADHFTEPVRLHEHAARRPDVTHPLISFLRPTGITHVAARATSIDTAARAVGPDDSPRDHALTGRPAAYTKERVVRSTVCLLHLASWHPDALPRIPGLG